MNRRRLPVLFALFLLVGCQDDSGVISPEALTPLHPAFAISDAEHADGNPNFFWLPPLVKNPPVTGDANQKLKPIVRVCADTEAPPATAEPCDSEEAVEEFRTNGGESGTGVQVKDEHYQVDWDTEASNLTLEETYRVWVLLGDLGIGFADVLIAANGKEARKADGEAFGLVDGRTLPLRFRLQVGVTLADPEVDCTEVDCAEFTVTNEAFDECTDGGQACLEASEGWLPEEFEDEEVTITIFEVERDPETNVCFGQINLPQERGCFAIRTFPDLGGATFEGDGVVFTMCQDPNLPPYYVIHQRTSSGEIRIPETILGIEPPGGRFCDGGTQIGMARILEWARPVKEFFLGTPLHAADGLAARLTSFSDFFYAPEVSVEAVNPLEEADAGSSILMTFRVVSDHHDHTGTPVEGTPVEFTADGGTLGPVNGTPTDTASGVSDGNGEVSVLWNLPDAAGPAALTATVPVAKAPSGDQPTVEVSLDVLGQEETATLTGSVTELTINGSPPPIPGATVSIPDLALSTTTNENGAYLLANVPLGEHTVRAEAVGFGPAEQPISVNEPGQQPGPSFALLPLVNSLTFMGADPDSDPDDDPTSVAGSDVVTVSIDYNTSSPNGVYIWAQPYTGGSFTSEGRYQPSGVLPAGEGSLTRWFGVVSSATLPIDVDHIRILMREAILTDDGTTPGDLLYEEFIPANLIFEDP